MKKYIYWSAIVVALIAGCAKNADYKEEDGRMFRIEAGMPGNDADTKVEYTPEWSVEKGYSLKSRWERNDIVSVICWQGDDDEWDSGMPQAQDRHYVNSSEISENGKVLSFEFKIPKNITDNSMPVKVLLTYLGKSEYKMRTDGNTHWGLVLPGGETNSTTPSDFTKFKYLDNQAPMICRAEIPAGWEKDASQKPVLKGQFRHLSTVFAVRIKNNRGQVIQPDIIKINFSGSKVIDAKAKTWNPISPLESDALNNQFIKMSIQEEYNPFEYETDSFNMYKTKSTVFFLPTVILNGGSPSGLSIHFEGKAGWYGISADSVEKPVTKTLKPGRCYSLSLEIDKDGRLEWTEEHSEQGEYDD